MSMSAYLSGFTYLLLLSPDKRGQTTNQIDTWAHLFKLPPHQQEVSWSTPVMLTKRESVTVPSMAHTCKPPPEPPPKGRLLLSQANYVCQILPMLEAPLLLQRDNCTQFKNSYVHPIPSLIQFSNHPSWGPRESSMQLWMLQQSMFTTKANTVAHSLWWTMGRTRM